MFLLFVSFTVTFIFLSVLIYIFFVNNFRAVNAVYAKETFLFLVR